jgi:hypothetical protein
VTDVRAIQREAAEDVFFGQAVIIAARYFLIVGLLTVQLSTLTSSALMALAVVPVVAFLAINFFLHARYLMERPANLGLIVVTSVIDLALVTAIVTFGPGMTGIASPFFVLYYPLVLAFAFVVPRRIEIGYTALAVVLHAVSVLLVDPSILGDMVELKRLVLRLITLAACGGIANYYWRMLRARRRAAAGPVPA